MPFETRGLVKSYNGVTVLHGVDLRVADGEVHALLGANGAGKSTLIKCVSGAVAPDRGEIVIDGRSHRALTPRGAREAGVAVIYQDLSLATSLDVADNVFLGRELRRGPFIRHAEQRAVTRRWLRRLKAPFEPTTPLSELGNADLQVVEIIKALNARPKVLILDEPTAALSEVEAAALAVQVRRLKETGLPILYVTHRLGEALDLADRVTVLSGGRVALSARISEVTRADLVAAIAGRRVDRPARPEPVPPGEPLLTAEGLVADGVGPLDLQLRRGEVTGVYGLLGSGRTELCETLAGARRTHRGRVALAGRPLTGGPARRVAAGVALVPADRLRRGVFATLPTRDNVLLPSYTRLARGPLRRRARELAVFRAAAGDLRLRPDRPDVEARTLSGGNQQKLVVARWLHAPHRCRVLLLDEPTQGVDVGARAELYRAVRAAARDGRAVLVTSSEPEELVQVADRVLVLAHGRVAAELRGGDVTESRMLELAHLDEEEA